MSRTRIFVAGVAVLLSAAPAPAQRHSANHHPSTNHPGTNQPSANHAGTNHPSTIHPGTNHPSINHPIVNHPSLAHLGADHPSMHHTGINHGYTGGVYQTGYAGGPSVVGASDGGFGYGGGVYRGTTHRHGHHAHPPGGAIGGNSGLLPDLVGTTLAAPSTFDIGSYLANFQQQLGASIDPAMIPKIGGRAGQQPFSTSPRRGGDIR